MWQLNINLVSGQKECVGLKAHEFSSGLRWPTGSIMASQLLLLPVTTAGRGGSHSACNQFSQW